MNTRFHQQGFDDATLTKLEIFKNYARNWISVILTASEKSRGFEEAQIYDFFSGPGKSAEGEIGSPLIIIDELKNYCRTRENQKKANISVKVFFNDKRASNVETLKAEVETVKCSKSCCKIEFDSKEFAVAFTEKLQFLKEPRKAKLVFLDQFGVKEVTQGTLEVLSILPHTDLLFFFSSSTINRFIDDPAIQKRFPNLSVKEIKDLPYKAIHKYMCEYFKENISNKDYFLAPFSLKKKGNIYGVIFGSSNLYGLEKFLDVCWDLDEVSGQANYNLDDDSCWHGKKPFTPNLFGETEKPKKLDAFRSDLKTFVQNRKPTNKDLYRFILENGLTPKKGREILLELLKEHHLKVEPYNSDKKSTYRKGSFYISWKDFKESEPKAIFEMAG